MFDRAQNLIVCNKPYGTIYRLPDALTVPGTPLREILSHRLAHDVHFGEASAYARRVVDIVSDGESLTGEFPLADGRILFITHRPIPGGGWISTHEDITARIHAERRAQQALHEQNVRLDAALENMSQGLAMFDRNKKLIVCNKRYATLYDLPPDLMVPGTTLRQILDYRIARGTYAGADGRKYADRVLTIIADNRPTSSEYTLPNGRVIAVSHWPMAGGGWLAMHEDVTERKQAEQELTRTKAFFDTVIENVPAAILVREARDHRYVIINRAAERFVGIGRDKVIGKTAADIFPKERAELIARHDAEALMTPNVPMHVDDHVIQVPGGGERIVTTRKLTVRDDAQEPLCLIAVIEDVTEKRKAEEQIAFLAHHDPLTGLPNRAQLTERLKEALDWVGRGKQLAVLFLDLDHFKTVNDTLGHFIGDELLKAVADRLRLCIRDVDLIGRLGGDEFAIVQTAIQQPADVSRLAHRIQEAIKAPYDLNGIQAVVDVSIGIALAPVDATDSIELMKRADMALYQAKAEGRSTFCFFEPAMDAAMKARRKLDTDLRSALAGNAFEMFYQPVVDLRSGEIVGVEGLLRWHHPEIGMVSPADFIPVAEETGLIGPIGEWVIRQVCADAVNWPGHIRVALNLSPVQLRSQHLVATIVNALATSGIAPSRLELEITEDVLLKHNQENLAVLEQLRRLGARIVMDDFGTGYCSLNYLRRFPFDKVKIDRAFIKDLSADNPEAVAIVEAVASLAGALRVSTTAEGVETQEQLALVRAAGCTEYQGYLFCAPKPKDEIVRRFFACKAKAVSAA
jgi:diguanylate cyclase (GGDEF)-like protein/PAS domain S-box-containing protein